MRQVEPSVELLAKPSIDWEAMRTYLDEVGGTSWADRVEEAESPTPRISSSSPDACATARGSRG
jgi:hypothetical protein